jgi:hypothetical protein
VARVLRERGAALAVRRCGANCTVALMPTRTRMIVTDSPGGFSWSSQRFLFVEVVVVVRRGRVPLPRSVRVAFWDGVRAGLPVADAGLAAGAGRSVWEWFRRAG